MDAAEGAERDAREDRGRRDRTTHLIAGLLRTAVAAQEARAVEQIFRIVREGLTGLGLSVYFAEVRGDRFRFFETEGFFRDLTAQVHGLRGESVPLDLAPIQQAIRNHPDGVLIDNLRELTAQVLGRPLAEIDLPPGIAAVGAALHVGGKIEFTITASGPELDRSLAPAFGFFARQLGTAIETSRRLEELAGSNRELMIVNHVAGAAATLGSARALETAMEWLARTVALDGIALFRCERGSELVLAVHAGMPEAWVARARRVPVSGDLPWSEAARGREARTFAVRRPGDAVAIPLRSADALQGVLIATRNGGAVSPEETRLLTTVGAQCAVSLQNELLFEQSQSRVRELSLLLELGQSVSGSLDQREIFAKGAQVAARVLRCSAAYIFAPDQTPGSLACAAREDPLAPVSDGIRLPLDRGSVSALAFHTGTPQMSGHSDSDPRIDAELNRLFGCRSTLAVPLVSHQRTLGVLVLIERGGSDAFNEQDVRVAVHAAQLLAASVENAALYAEQRRRAEEMAGLNEASRALAGPLDLEPLLNQSADALRKMLAADHCLVYLLDGPKQTLLLHQAPDLPPELRGKQIAVERPTVAGHAVREGRAVQVHDAPHSEKTAKELVLLFKSSTVLAIPLSARGEQVGAVVLDDTRPGRVFTPAEVERASTVAGQIAMAIITVRLIEDLRRSLGELERAQAERLDRERLAVLGELSASIAHEVRNPLGVIFNALASLRRMLRPEGNVGLLLGIIGEEADRLNRMVNDLLDYSRPYKPALQPVSLAPLVADALRSAFTQAGRSWQPSSGSDRGLAVEVRVDEALTLRADQRLLRQALINLFLNALQAMPKGGSLEVIAERADGPRGKEARLRIRDSGPGIPESVRARVFHPFFTTKATGTGLGLAVVKRIIDGHRGRIALRERGGEAGDEIGAEFELWLPVEETA